MDTKVLRLQAIGLAAVIVTCLAAVWLGLHYPWMAPYLPPVVGAVGGYVGKLLGVPVDAVTQAALAALASKRPDKAVQVAVGALQSLPPQQAEDATRQLLQSIPPAARSRALNRLPVELLNTTEPPPPTPHDAG